MTPNELRDIARLIEDRISLHGRLIGAQLPMETIAEASRLAIACMTEAAELSKPKPVPKEEVSHA